MPRVTAYMNPKGEVHLQIQKALEKYTNEAVRTTFSLMDGYKFYKNDETPMSAYQVKPFLSISNSRFV
eukprot:TRINITY_DN9600_c0_g1_i1.p2 TRINITY_DN9600_c0_g1~~TRINITY_DN9600_c0_g1_i1.p2  ORF type:complete len:68 (-),score=4.30 TRINITY_DN9600_c0_g1_i1:223-426(-)